MSDSDLQFLYFNRYRILRVVNDNPPAMLYEAVDEQRQQPVALKVWTIKDSTQYSALLQAAGRRRQMYSPALPGGVEVLEQGNMIAIATTWIPGPTLAERLPTEGPFRADSIYRWAGPLLTALDTFHRQTPTLVHGDVKADNLKENALGQLMLLDIELITDETYAVADDIYAVCATFYHLLTEIRPPSAAQRRAGPADPLPTATEVNPEVPPALAQVLARGMAVNPNERYSSILALQVALENARLAPAAPPPPQPQEPTRMNAPDPNDPLAPRPDTPRPEESPTTPQTPPPAFGADATPRPSAQIFGSPPPVGDAPRTPPLPPSPFGPSSTVATPRDPNISSLPGNTPPPSGFGTPPSPPPFQAQGSTPPPFTPPPYQGQSTAPFPQSTPGTPETPPPPGNNRRNVWLIGGAIAVVLVLCICCGLFAVAQMLGTAIGDGSDIGTIFDQNNTNNDNNNTSTDNNDGTGIFGNSGDEVSVFDLEVGACYDQPGGSGGSVSDYTARDCDEPHDLEVFSIFDFDAGANADYPGEDELTNFADEQCVADFEEYVGLDYASSQYYYSTLYPNQQSWESIGDREIVCFLHNQNYDPIEGSVRGSGE